MSRVESRGSPPIRLPGIRLSCHAVRPNEKAQVRPPRLRETKRSRANWHGSKASPAAIWFDIVFITQNSRLNYKEPQTGSCSACSEIAQKDTKATKKGRTLRSLRYLLLRSLQNWEDLALVERQSSGAASQAPENQA